MSRTTSHRRCRGPMTASACCQAPALLSPVTCSAVSPSRASPGLSRRRAAPNAVLGDRAGLAGTVAQAGDANRVLGRPIEHVVQQMVDGIVWAQNDSGVAGSWYYTPNNAAVLFHEGVPRGPIVGLLSAGAMKHAGVYVNG